MRNRFNDLTIGKKLNIGFGVLVLLLLLIVGLIFTAGREATDKINLTVDVRVPAALASARAQSSLLKMRAAVRGYLAVGDLQNIDDYNRAKEVFQENIAQLKTLSEDWSDEEDVQHLDDLIEIFAAWLPLPEQVFALHDNPLENQPALRLVTGQVQPLSATLQSDVQRLIELQSARPSTSANRALLATLIDFHASLQGMITNLRAYAGTSDLVFKFGYSEQLIANSTLFGDLLNQQAELTAGQQAIFTRVEGARTLFLRLADPIFAAVEGERSHEDLYLFQNQMEPQAEQMLLLLEELTAVQQTRLQQELNDGARSLVGVQVQTLIGGLLALLFGVLMAYLVRKSIAGPVRRLNAAAQALGRGDLEAQARVEHGDEIGRLAQTFNSMAGRLRTMIDELAQARDAAETANRAKSDFLARMSHELRTPLNGILGYVQILMRNGRLDPAQQQALTVVRDSGEHLLTLITDILDLSKIEARKLELTPANFALRPFLNGLVELFRIHAEQGTGVAFRFDAPPELPSVVYGDEKRLRQILINLLDNAFKFTTEGEIVLGVEWLRAEEGAPSDACLRFTVSDTGPGMSPEQIESIFLPFEQVGNPKQRAQGAGLGLAISQELAHAMGGQLTVESGPGRGTTFVLHVRLPIDGQGSSEMAAATGTIDPRTRADARSAATPAAQVPAAPAVTPPPPPELAVLLDMALKGELPRLRKRVNALAESDPLYAPFVDGLNELLDSYDEERLLALLQQYSQEPIRGDGP